MTFSTDQEKSNRRRKVSLLRGLFFLAGFFVLALVFFVDLGNPFGTSATLDVVTDGGTSGRLAKWVGSTGPSVVLTASPSSGVAPLGVSLTATTSNTPNGATFYYYFDCENNDGTFEASYGSTSSTSYTALGACRYSPAGTYTAFVKVDVTSGGTTSPITNTTTITVSATPPPPTPTLSLDKVGCSRAELSWTDVSTVGHPIYYHMERKIGTESFSEIWAATGTSGVDSGDGGTTYTYRIRAEDLVTGLFSGYSNEATGTMLSCTYEHGAKFINQSVPATMAAGETKSVSITMKNCRPDGDCRDTPTRRLASWYKDSWVTITASFGRSADDFEVIGDNDIYVIAGSLFWHWNGYTWSVVTKNNFTTISPQYRLNISKGVYYTIGLWQDSTSKVSKWDGTNWTAITGDKVVNDFFRIADNDIFAIRNDSACFRCIWHWDGAKWDYFIPGLSNLRRFHIIFNNSNIPIVYASGFDYRMHKWDGASWQDFANDGRTAIFDFAAFTQENDVYAITDSGAQRWDGDKWTIIPSGVGFSIDNPRIKYYPRQGLYQGEGGYLYKYGPFDRLGAVDSLDRTAWSRIASEGGPLFDFQVFAKDNFYVLSGDRSLLHWNGVTLEKNSINARFSGIYSMQVDSASKVYAVGSTNDVEGSSDNKFSIYEWTSSGARRLVQKEAQPMYGGFHVIADNNIFAARDDSACFRCIWHWDGAKWDYFIPGLGNIARFRYISPTSIIASAFNGFFSSALYKWNGSKWLQYPSGSLGVSFAIGPKGADDVYSFSNNGGGPRKAIHWDGKKWNDVTDPIRGEFLDYVDGEGLYTTVVSNPTSGYVYLSKALGYLIRWGLDRVDLLASSQTVGPSEQTTFTFNITAPLTPGIYDFKWQMLSTNGWGGGVSFSEDFFNEPTPNVKITVVRTCNDIGLRMYDATLGSTIIINTEPAGTLTSLLRVRKGGVTYGVVLVDPGGPNASPIHIKTPLGIKALQTCPM